MNKAIKKIWSRIKYSNVVTFFTGGMFKHPYPIFYRIKCFIFRPYTTIKPRNLGHTWCDTTELIPHMLFELLERFLVGEMNLSLETYKFVNPPIVITSTKDWKVEETVNGNQLATCQVPLFAVLSATGSAVTVWEGPRHYRIYRGQSRHCRGVCSQACGLLLADRGGT